MPWKHKTGICTGTWYDSVTALGAALTGTLTAARPWRYPGTATASRPWRYPATPAVSASVTVTITASTASILVRRRAFIRPHTEAGTVGARIPG